MLETVRQLYRIVQILDDYAPLIPSVWDFQHEIDAVTMTIVDKTNATPTFNPRGQGNGQDLALLYHRSGEERLISFLCEICMEMKFPEDGSLHARSNPWHFSFLSFSFLFRRFPGKIKRWRAMQKN